MSYSPTSLAAFRSELRGSSGIETVALRPRPAVCDFRLCGAAKRMKRALMQKSERLDEALATSRLLSERLAALGSNGVQALPGQDISAKAATSVLPRSASEPLRGAGIARTAQSSESGGGSTAAVVEPINHRSKTVGSPPRSHELAAEQSPVLVDWDLLDEEVDDHCNSREGDGADVSDHHNTEGEAAPASSAQQGQGASSGNSTSFGCIKAEKARVDGLSDGQKAESSRCGARTDTVELKPGGRSLVPRRVQSETPRRHSSTVVVSSRSATTGSIGGAQARHAAEAAGAPSSPKPSGCRPTTESGVKQGGGAATDEGCTGSTTTVHVLISSSVKRAVGGDSGARRTSPLKLSVVGAADEPAPETGKLSVAGAERKRKISSPRSSTSRETEGSLVDDGRKVWGGMSEARAQAAVKEVDAVTTAQSSRDRQSTSPRKSSRDPQSTSPRKRRRGSDARKPRRRRRVRSEKSTRSLLKRRTSVQPTGAVEPGEPGAAGDQTAVRAALPTPVSSFTVREGSHSGVSLPRKGKPRGGSLDTPARPVTGTVPAGDGTVDRSIAKEFDAAVREAFPKPGVFGSFLTSKYDGGFGAAADRVNPPRKLCGVGAGRPRFKAQEVVRDKNERRQLQGYACQECERFYEMAGLPEHARALMKQCSRHRARHSPDPPTQESFWVPRSMPHSQGSSSHSPTEGKM